jgi:imidazole glycerol-phosphate synthase subunit HisH
MSELAIIDYGMGNLRSVQKAIERVGGEARIVSRPLDLLEFSGVILPGVGSFPAAVRQLRRRGWIKPIKEAAERIPLLGICLGLQLFFQRSEEGESARGLGLLEGEVVRFPPAVKVPHMGWNQLRFPRPHPIFAGLDQETFVYFVHSYYPRVKDASTMAAITDYGVQFTSAVAKGNLVGVQFHPEKSQATGLKILGNFLRMTRDTEMQTS